MSLSDQDLTTAAAGADPLVGLRAVRALRRLLEHLEQTQVEPRACGRLVVAGDRRRARRQQAGRAQEAPGSSEGVAMFERFTRRSRAVVEAAVEGAKAAGAREVRPEHLLEAILDGGPGRCGGGARAARGAGDEMRATLPRSRSRRPGELDEGDAEALRVLGIDLDDVVRRIEGNLGGDPPRRADTCRSRSGARSRSSSPCARRCGSGTASSGPSTSCSVWSAVATRSCSTPWRRSTSSPTRSGPRWRDRASAYRLRTGLTPMSDHDRREVRPDHLLRAALDDGWWSTCWTSSGRRPPPSGRPWSTAGWRPSTTSTPKRCSRSGSISTTSSRCSTRRTTPSPTGGDGCCHRRHGTSSSCAGGVQRRPWTPRACRPLLLGLLRSHDPLVAGTFRAHGVRLRPARALVAEWGRRAG